MDLLRGPRTLGAEQSPADIHARSSKSMGSFGHADKAQTAHDQLVTALAHCTSTGEQTDITQAVHTSRALWLVAVSAGRTDWGKVVLEVSTPSCTNSSWICCVDRGLSVQNKALLTSMQGPPRAWDPLANATRHNVHVTNWLPRLHTARPQESKPTSHKKCTRAGPSGSHGLQNRELANRRRSWAQCAAPLIRSSSRQHPLCCPHARRKLQDGCKTSCASWPLADQLATFTLQGRRCSGNTQDRAGMGRHDDALGDNTATAK